MTSGFRSDQPDMEVSHFQVTAHIIETTMTYKRRNYPRISMQEPITVIVTVNGRDLHNAQAENISMGGMLICDTVGQKRYRLDSMVSDISISSYTQTDRKNGHSSKKIWTSISKGRVVRSEFNEKSAVSYYGIMFLHENFSMKERLNLLINDFICQQHSPPFDPVHRIGTA